MQTKSIIEGVQLRLANSDDVGALTELSILSKSSNGYDESFMAKCRDDLTVTEGQLLQGEYWIVETTVLCGFACLNTNYETRSGKLHSFFIAPDLQRKGVGQLLWQKILQRAKTKSLKTLHLDADPFAVPFYTAMGFTVEGFVPSGSIEGRELPHMTYELD